MPSALTETANAVKQALEQDKEQDFAIAEQLQEGIFLAQKYHISYANPTLMQMLGSETTDQIKNVPLLSLLTTEDAEIIKDDLPKILKDSVPEKEYEVTVTRFDGRKIVIRLLLTKIIIDGKIHTLGVVNDLSRIIDIEYSLYESKVRYRTLVENALDGIYIINPEGFEFVNPAFESITGYGQAEVCDASFDFYGLIHPDDHKLISEREQARRRGEQLPSSYQFRIITKEGTIRYVEVNTVPLAETEPRVLGMLRDVTDRQTTIDKIMVGERKYRTLFEGANDANFLMTEDVLIDCNQKTLEMFNIQKQDIVGHHPYDYSPDIQPNGKDSKKELLRYIKATLKNEPQQFYWQFLRHDRTPFDAYVSLKKIDLEGSVFIQVIVRDITPEKRAEELLRIAEENYRGIFENAVMGIYKSTPEGYHISANPALAQIYGYESPGDLITNMRDIAEQLYVDPHRREELLSHLIESDEVTRFESQIYRKDGQIIWISENARTVRDANGAIQYFVGTVEDISARKETEQQLQRFSAAVETTTDGVAVTDLKGFIIDINQSLTQMLGGSASAAFIGKNSLDFVAEEHRKPVQDQMTAVREGGQLTSLEFTIHALDDTTVPVEMSASLMTAEDGHASGYVCILRDVTARKAAQQALQASEEQYRTLFENTGTAMAIINPDTTIAEINSQFERMLGYTKEEIISKPWSPFVHEDDRPRIRQYHQQRRESDEKAPKKYEFRAYDNKGNIRHILINIEMLPNSQKSIASLIDITDREQARQALKESEEKLRNFFETSEAGIWCFRPNEPLDISLDEDTLLPQAFDGVLVECNDQYARMMGTDRKKLLGVRLADLLPDSEENRTYLRSFITNNFRLSGGISREVTASGQEKYFSNSLVGTVRDGYLMEVWGTQMDVTDLKLMEVALRKSEKQFRGLIENANDAIYIITEKGFDYVNTAFEEMVGYSEEEIFSDDFSFWNLIHDDDKPLIIERQKARARGEHIPSRYEFRLTAKDGVIKILEATTVNIGEDGETRVMGILRDITDRIEMEEAMKESEEKFKLLTESSTSAIFIYQDNSFRYLNPAMEMITGYSREELADIFWDFVHPDHQDLVKDREIRRQQGEQVDPARYEVCIITKANTVKWIDFAATTITYGGAPAALGNAYDITERKKAEEIMERALEQERDFKLRAAHHFFNPIAIAKGYLDLTLEELTELQETKVKAARDAICRVEKVVKNVTETGEIHE